MDLWSYSRHGKPVGCSDSIELEGPKKAKATSQDQHSLKTFCKKHFPIFIFFQLFLFFPSISVPHHKRVLQKGMWILHRFTPGSPGEGIFVSGMTDPSFTHSTMLLFRKNVLNRHDWPSVQPLGNTPSIANLKMDMITCLFKLHLRK